MVAIRLRVFGTVALVAVLVGSCTTPEKAIDQASPTTATSLEPATTAVPVTAPTTEAATTTQAAIVSGSVCGAASESETAQPDIVPGAERVDAFAIQQVWVPSGTFIMGTVDASDLEPPGFAIRELASEQPAHEVTITAGFWIDKYEVTVLAYKAFDAAGGYNDPACWSVDGWEWRQSRGDRVRAECGADGPDVPRACVNWYEAEAYATWRGAALPTEAQWEYAARGPESLVYPWGQEWDPHKANVVDADGTVPVGSYPDGASWVGAHDMSGNVMEWVADWLAMEYYAESPTENPTGPVAGRIKVEKGGWWGNVPYVARAAYRHFEDPPHYRDEHIGFRVVSLEV